MHGVVQEAEVFPRKQSLDRREVEDSLQEFYVLLRRRNLRRSIFQGGERRERAEGGGGVRQVDSRAHQRKHKHEQKAINVRTVQWTRDEKHTESKK